MLDVLLRRDALSTLVHEVGHHIWLRTRFAPGKDKPSEEYARQYEYRGITQYVLPYLEAAYPAEVDRLLSWIEGHVGIKLSLAALQPNREDSWASMFSGW